MENISDGAPKVTFGQFADKVIKEFKLDAIQGTYNIFARMDDSMFMMNLNVPTKLNNEVEVRFKLQYGLKDNPKIIGFSHIYRFGDIVPFLDDCGVIKEPEKLPIEQFKLRMLKTNYNFGTQKNGFDFDSYNFIGKMFKRCEADNKAKLGLGKGK